MQETTDREGKYLLAHHSEYQTTETHTTGTRAGDPRRSQGVRRPAADATTTANCDRSTPTATTRDTLPSHELICLPKRVRSPATEFPLRLPRLIRTTVGTAPDRSLAGLRVFRARALPAADQFVFLNPAGRPAHLDRYMPTSSLTALPRLPPRSAAQRMPQSCLVRRRVSFAPSRPALPACLRPGSISAGCFCLVVCGP